MGECVIKIERLNNGWEVEMTDPEIVKQNQKPSKGNSYTPYKDPKVAYAFKKKEEVVKFISANLEKAMPMDEYESSFDEAAATEEED